MSIKKIINWLHLWLGLVSGVVVVIVSITGAILVYEKDIREITEPYQKSTVTSIAQLLPPSVLMDSIKSNTGRETKYISYNGIGHSAYGMASGYKMMSEAPYIYIDPTNGHVLKYKKMKDDFFRVVLKGHYYLWLPNKIGSIVVSGGTLIYLVTLLTGLVLWWPKKRKYAKNGLRIKKGAGVKRLNYDLHNVLGFYVLSILFVISITGMVLGAKWFANGFYFITSGGKSLAAKSAALSMLHQHEKGKKNNNKDSSTTMLDLACKSVMRKRSFTEQSSIMVYPPSPMQKDIKITYSPDKNTTGKTETFYYDVVTCKEKKSGKENAPHFNMGDWLKKNNLDLHRGSIGGMWSKVLAFLACLISASLPITGFFIWFNKNNKSNTKK